MRVGGSGSAAILPAKYKFKKICPTAGSWGTVATSTPRESDDNGSNKEKGGSISKDQNEPMVALSKPPPHPHFLGPLLAFSLLETWSRRDADDN
ncbi:hypothetical protein like AT4G23493 [Hibiscus trionum]|uniref:Uncharacterized protein n=1 Tax=Hibiscus trionum TaxID=183268 RepID=A0A9W7I4P5_HIBTR|nr:hypothetical protein like AT4G23493 [Hibiscus trionum]